VALGLLAAPGSTVATDPGVTAAAATTDAGERWRPGLELARDYAADRAGTIGFAVRTERRLYRSDAYRSFRSASVVKAMLMVAYLNHPSVRSRPMREADRVLLEPMVRWSDNAAASRVRDFVDNGALIQLARRVGMGRFAVAPSWGDSQVTAAGQTKLFLGIDRYVVRRHRRAALRLLATIVPEQRWGIGRVRPPAWRLYFKGGWGDGSGAVDHQVALLRRGDRRIALAIMTADNPSHAYGKQTLEGVARRLLRGLRADSIPR
jgi:Beta-lactamase enzyme family